MKVSSRVFMEIFHPPFGDEVERGRLGAPISAMKRASATYEAYKDRLQVGTRVLLTAPVWVGGCPPPRSRFYC